MSSGPRSTDGMLVSVCEQCGLALVGAVATILHYEPFDGSQCERHQRRLSGLAARRRTPPTWVGEPPHGTLARYRWSRGPCRCQDCRDACRAYQRELKARHRATRRDAEVPS